MSDYPRRGPTWATYVRGFIAAWLVGIGAEGVSSSAWNPLSWQFLTWIIAVSFFIGWCIAVELLRA